MEVAQAFAAHRAEQLLQRQPQLTLKHPPGTPFTLAVAVHGRGVVHVTGASMGALLSGRFRQAAMPLYYEATLNQSVRPPP